MPTVVAAEQVTASDSIDKKINAEKNRCSVSTARRVNRCK